MIYPDVSVEKWCKRFGLKVIHRRCDACNAPMSTTIPFLETGYAGLRTPPCACGKNRFAASTSVTTTAKAAAEWAQFGV